MTSTELANRVQQMQSQYDRESGALASLKERQEAVVEQILQTDVQLDTYEKVQLLFSKTSELARTQIKVHVERTVTAALQAVFGRELRFEVALREVGGQTAADWRVVDSMEDEEVRGDPEDARGGGVSDVVALALRLALLELVRPKLGGPILLDEVGKHVSAEHRTALAEFLKAYAQRTGRQILLVTHAEELAGAADVAYRVERRNGVSEVARI